MSEEKPLIVACACPISGHVSPILALSRGLVERGYDVSVVTGTAFKDKVEAIGATLMPLEGKANYSDETINTIFPMRSHIPHGPPRLLFDLQEVFTGTLVEKHEGLQKALKSLSSQGKPILVVSEVLFMGAHPISLGAPGIKPTGWISIGNFPILARSVDTPRAKGLHDGDRHEMDTSPEGRARKAAINKAMEEHVFAGVKKKHLELLKQAGAVDDPHFVWEQSYFAPDVCLQLCPPSLEYPRSDMPPPLRFAGSVPHSHVTSFDLPDWWAELLSAKKVVMVTQGTYAVDYSHLIIPTLEALKTEPETFVVAILGRRGATLPDTYEVPKNAHVLDFFPYDQILAHSNVFVTNAGYGGVQQSLSYSVPMVLAGGSEEKPEVAKRTAWAGVGIDLETGEPSPEQLKAAVDEVLTHDKYRQRSAEIKKELEKYSSVDILDSTIKEVIAAK